MPLEFPSQSCGHRYARQASPPSLRRSGINDLRWVKGDFAYQARSWDRSSRVLAKVEWHSDELLTKGGVLVTVPLALAQVFAILRYQRNTSRLDNT